MLAIFFFLQEAPIKPFYLTQVNDGGFHLEKLISMDEEVAVFSPTFLIFGQTESLKGRHPSYPNRCWIRSWYPWYLVRWKTHWKAIGKQEPRNHR
ncbi:hypothetical protein BB777_07560 [Planococcus faecalis]|nr:hypothetical protein BB777_07560 [Planococcus faecalis]